MDLADIPELPDRDKRIAEVLTDTYGEDEELVAFETYLDAILEFPFNATWCDTDEEGHAEPVKVLGVAGSDPRRGVLLKVERLKTRKVRQLEAGQVWPKAKKSINSQALDDYRHWAGNGLVNFDEYEEDEEEEIE